MRNKNISDLMARKTNAETNLEQSKIHYDEEINNQNYVKAALDNPDSKDHLVKALEKFASKDSKLGFNTEEISVIAMIVMFPEQYGLTLNDIKKILFSQVDTELKNSISDIFAMNKQKENKKEVAKTVEKEEQLQRSSRMDYSKIDLFNKKKEKEPKEEKTVVSILKDAAYELTDEELELAKNSKNQENILNILKYTSKKGVTPSCFKYHIKSLINSDYKEFEKISNELLSKRPLEDVETIFGNILDLKYEDFKQINNPKTNLAEMFYKQDITNSKVKEEPKLSEVAQFVEDDKNDSKYINILDSLDEIDYQDLNKDSTKETREMRMSS